MFINLIFIFFFIIHLRILSCFSHNLTSFFKTSILTFCPCAGDTSLRNFSYVFFYDDPHCIIVTLLVTGPRCTTLSIRSSLIFIHRVGNYLNALTSLTSIIKWVLFSLKALRTQIVCLQLDILMITHSAMTKMNSFYSDAIFYSHRFSAPRTLTDSISVCVANSVHALMADLY